MTLYVETVSFQWFVNDLVGICSQSFDTMLVLKYRRMFNHDFYLYLTLDHIKVKLFGLIAKTKLMSHYMQSQPIYYSLAHVVSSEDP